MYLDNNMLVNLPDDFGKLFNIYELRLMNNRHPSAPPPEKTNLHQSTPIISPGPRTFPPRLTVITFSPNPPPLPDLTLLPIRNLASKLAVPRWW